MSANTTFSQEDAQASKNFSPSFWVVAVILLTAIAFSPCLSCSFVNWDDDIFLGNALTQSLPFSNIIQIFTSNIGGRYYPLSVLGLQVQVYLFGLQTWAYHAVNLGLHVINIFLVFRILRNLKIDRWVTVVTTSLFAVHPLQVETVAWISSFKDLLFSVFFLSAIDLYTKGSPQEHSPKKQYYYLGLYFLALSAKVTAISLPLVLLIADYYRKGKLSFSDWKEKTPLFILGIAFAAINLQAVHSANAFVMSKILTVTDGLWLSAYALLLYTTKLLFPFSLCSYYPLPPQFKGAFALEIYAAAMSFLFLVTTWLIKNRRNKSLLGAVLFFFIMLLPCLHVIKINNCLIYEHFVYLPSLGLFLIISSLICRFIATRQQGLLKNTAIFTVAAVILFLAALSWDRCHVWSNSETLWTDVIQKNPNSPAGYLHLQNIEHNKKN